MSELVASLSTVFTLAFAVSSMFSLGLRLTVGEIIEPLRNTRLLIMALLANFVIVPAAAFVLGRLFMSEPDLQIGLILLSSAAGAPLVPKLVQIARGRIRTSVGLVVLLIIGSVIYLPLVLPLLLPGVRVDALDIALRLFLQMLLPLGAGLFVNARYDEEAENLLPVMSQVSNVSLALMLVLMIGLNVREVFGLVGSGAIVAAALLVAIAMTAGYFLAGPDPTIRRTLAIATGQRNIAAALVVGTGNFSDRPDVLVMLVGAGLVSMIIAIPVVGEFGRRAKAAEAGAIGTGEVGTAGVPVPGEPSLRASDSVRRP